MMTAFSLSACVATRSFFGKGGAWRRWALGLLLGLLVGIPEAGWSAGPPIPDPWQPQYPDEGVAITEMAPLSSGTVSLPGLPEGGVVELEEVEMTLPEALRVEAVGWLIQSGERRDYVWAEDPEAEFEEAPELGLGRVRLRWFWEGQRIDSLTDWLRDENPGKGGNYQVKLYQTQETYTWGPQWPTGFFSETEMPVATASFKVVIRGHVPLAEGERPVFTSVPDVPLAPAVTVVPQEGILLSVMANAGGPFRLRWYKDEVAWRSGAEVRVMPGDVTQAGTNFSCTVTGPTGVGAVTGPFRLRAPIPPLVDFSASVNVVEAGGTVRLVPGVTEETGVTFSWSGPALTAGYAGAQVLEDGVLEIAEARMEDAGVYSLTVGNEEGEAVRAVQVRVLRVPRGVYALAPGRIAVVGAGTASTSVVWDSLAQPGGMNQIFKRPYGVVRQGELIIFKPQAKMAGEYLCTVQVAQTVPRDVWVQGRLVVEGTLATRFVAESVVELRKPWEKPVMPEHELAVARVGQYYYLPGPVTPAGGAATAAVRYLVTGLPPGLRAQADGDVVGTPLRGGVYKLKFVAVNAQGRSAPREVLLTVLALPEGTVGEWLAFSDPGAGTPWKMQIKMTGKGTFTARGPFGSAAGKVYVDEEGRVHLHIFRGLVPETVLLPETNTLVVTAYDGYAPGRGWRNVWSRTNPPEVYAGRYNFAAQPLAGPGGEEEEVCAEAGFRSGTALVEATGVVKSVVTGERGVATTSSFFLGPQGQVLHEVKLRGKPTGDFFLELAIDETGQVIQGQVPDAGELFKTPEGVAIYDFTDPITRALWPDGLQREYAGRRYTPPAAGALPAGFSVPETGANAWLTLGLPEAESFATPEGEVTVDAQAWLLAKGGRMRLMGTATHAATCKVHLPTGLFSGKVRFANGRRRPPATKFQGFLVPQAEGGVVGYGATEPARGWESLPVTLEAVAEE